ncbi:MAG: hypothetical protein PHY47_09700 [Lachnospiraceae bacterium]|nr:hypothetical protein [Lachnospiraceae bacterium]
MKHKKLKQAAALFMSVVIMATVIPNMPGSNVEVQAATLSNTQFASSDELLSKYSLYGDGEGTIARIKFGSSDRKWLIAGSYGVWNPDDKTLALLSTSYFCSCAYESSSSYSNSTIAKTLFPNYLSGTAYFSETEKSYMKDTTVSSSDVDGKLSTFTAKLYLADAKEKNSFTFYVGSDNQFPILLSDLSFTNGFVEGMGYFWLRSMENGPCAYVVSRYFMDTSIQTKPVNYELGVLPAFDLDLSAVSFASAANAATSDGALTIDNAFTLRYESGLLGSATINPSGTSIAVSDAPAGTYLVVQNSDGAWAKSVSGTKTMNASEVTINGSALSSLTGCRVWLESTDADRITKGTLATQLAECDVTITNPSDSHISYSSVTGNGSESQTGLTEAMTNVLYIADSGYYFPTDYNSDGSMNGNGVTVTRDSDTQITVSGTPTANANITLIAATEKAVQDAPTGLSDGIEKIAGTTPAMEYASSTSAATWDSCTDGNTTVVAGTWYVRYKETDTKKESPATQVIVTSSGNPPSTIYHSITAVVSPTNGGSVSGGGQVPDGGSTTLKATANSGYHFQKWTKGGNTVGTSNTLLLTGIVEDAEYTAFFTKNNRDSEEESKNEAENESDTQKEAPTPQIPSALPYRTTQGTFKGEKNAFNIKALESSVTSTTNQNTLANFFTTQYFRKKTGTIMACYDMYAPWGAKKEWKEGTCNFSWNMDGIRAGDTVFVIWYNEQNPLGAQFIKAMVSADNRITFTVPYLGDVSTISIVKVK